MNISRTGPVADGSGPSVRQRISGLRAELTPSEVRVVTVLLDDWPVAGMQPAVALAAAAGVSPPTVLRLLAKLGFSGYPEFRSCLTAELAGPRAFSPLTTYPDLAATEEPMLACAERMIVDGVRSSLAGLDGPTVDRVTSWLADPAATVWLTGGKFSAVLAAYLAGYLRLLRPGVTGVAPSDGERARALLDIDEGSVCVVFDYRRYQADTVTFGRRAAAAGARLVVLTDPYLSPLADGADAVLTSVVAGPSPYDVLAPAFAVVEAVLATVTGAIGAAAAGRLGRFEGWQEEDNAGTPARRPPRRPPRPPGG